MTYTWKHLQKKPQDAKRLLGVSYDNLVALIKYATSLDKQAQEKVENATDETRGALIQTRTRRTNNFDPSLSASKCDIFSFRFNV